MNVENASKQLHKIFECGKKAGISHAMFISFGTLLGCIREGGLIPHDGDTDVGIRSDWITKEQEVAFYNELNKNNLFRYRRKKATRWYNKNKAHIDKNKDPDLKSYGLEGKLTKGKNETENNQARPYFGGKNDRLLWLSLMSDNPKEYDNCNLKVGVKSCIWFFFPWRRWLWHCKGGRWLTKIGNKTELQKHLPNDLFMPGKYMSIMKGNTLSCFDKLIPKKFIGGTFNVPIGYGQLLDEFYPNWSVPKVGGASSRHRIVLIGDWANESTWKFVEEGQKPRR